MKPVKRVYFRVYSSRVVLSRYMNGCDFLGLRWVFAAKLRASCLDVLVRFRLCVEISSEFAATRAGATNSSSADQTILTP